MPEVHKAATLHITEILGEEQIEELHLCEECAQKYLYEPQQKQTGIKTSPGGSGEEPDEPAVLNRECDICGVKFVDFRNSGRLGCPHDYEVFRDELLPLLENIHGETKHCGKTPRRLPQNKQMQSELIQVRERCCKRSTRRRTRRPRSCATRSAAWRKADAGRMKDEG